MAKRKSKVRKNFQINRSHISKDYKHPTSLIAIPSGYCPVVLAGTSDEEILEWAKLVKKSAGPGHEYTVNSIQYWVRDFYEPVSPERKLVRSRLYELRDEIGVKWLSPPTVSQEALDRFNKERGNLLKGN